MSLPRFAIGLLMYVAAVGMLWAAIRRLAPTGFAHTPNRRNSLSPLWIVLYITLHLLWRQFFPSGLYLILPFSFLALFILVFVARGQSPGISEHLIGRWLPRRADWPIGCGFIVGAGVLRLLLRWCFEVTPESKQLAVVADRAVFAPFNEELIFRGLFLGILLARLPRARPVAIGWSAAIFLSFHSIPGVDVPAILGILSLGLLCGAAYATTRCVPLCIVCHALFNVLQWLM